MSLFGSSWEDPKTAAILGLAGGLIQGNAGAGLQQGLLGYQRQAQINNQTARQSKYDAREDEEFALKKTEAQRKIDSDKLMRETLKQAATELQAGTFNPAKYAGVLPAETLKGFVEMPNWGRSEVARTVKGVGPDGREYEYREDKYGQRMGDALPQYRAPLMQDLGGQVAALDPYTLQPKAQFGKSMTPDGRAADARGWASNDLARQRLDFDRQGGAEGLKPRLVGDQWVTPPTGMAPGQAVPAVKPTAVKDANEALALIRQAEEIIPKSTGSYAGAAVDQVGRFFGASTGGDTAAAQLKALEGALVSKMPKMSGPQSDKDVLLYKQMAGEIGDPTIPQSRKLAALEVIKTIQQRHAGPQAELPAPGAMGSGSFGATPTMRWNPQTRKLEPVGGR